MTLEADIFAALAPIIPWPNPPLGMPTAKVFPDTFPQALPWPAIRYTFISSVPEQTICGSGGDAETDIRVQIDGIAATGLARDALRLAIIAAMTALPTPCVCESWSKDYDAETKSYRVIADFLFQPSSEPGDSDSPLP